MNAPTYYLITANYHGGKKQTRATADTLTLAEAQAHKFARLLTHDGDYIDVYVCKGGVAQRKVQTYGYHAS